ncbi:sulfatase-like hydrolase/transferase, partial [bacterium]|nr:sulfatase-like hydrolase/transferase [bacterium]
MSISRRQFLAVSAAGVASLPALGNIWAQEEGKRNQPNILFLVTDDQRFDALACAGNSAIRTPHIDKLAKTGVVFTNTICQGTACVPSRASMLTASYPHNNGVYSNQCAAMHPTQWTFPRALQETGYYTAIFGKSHFQVL